MPNFNLVQTHIRNCSFDAKTLRNMKLEKNIGDKILPIPSINSICFNRSLENENWQMRCTENVKMIKNELLLTVNVEYKTCSLRVYINQFYFLFSWLITYIFTSSLNYC